MSNFNELFLAVALLVLAVHCTTGIHNKVHAIAQHILCLISVIPAQCVKGGGVKRSCCFGKTEAWISSLGLGWVVIHLEPLLIQPFQPSMAKNSPKIAINGHFGAISRPGGSKLVDQRGSRLDLARAHPGRCVRTLSRVRNGHRGAP